MIVESGSRAKDPVKSFGGAHASIVSSMPVSVSGLTEIESGPK